MDFNEKIRNFIDRIETIKDTLTTEEATKTALIMVGEFLGKEYNNSKLYDKDFKHEYRF